MRASKQTTLEAILDSDKSPSPHSYEAVGRDEQTLGIMVCKSCGQLVPATLYCVYCGSTLLARIKEGE